jgi:hypothetical protein
MTRDCYTCCDLLDVQYQRDIHYCQHVSRWEERHILRRTINIKRSLRWKEVVTDRLGKYYEYCNLIISMSCTSGTMAYFIHCSRHFV